MSDRRGASAPFLLTSVRHTGTHSAIHILRDFRRQPVTCDDDADYWFAHCERPNMPALTRRLETGIPLILTMRNPMDAARSWHKRGVVLNEYFCNMWQNLFALQRAYNGLWLPVDTPDRDMRLAAISERLGVHLTTDWKPRNSTSEDLTPRGGMTLGECLEFFRTLPFDEFYTEKDLKKKATRKKPAPVERHGIVFTGDPVNGQDPETITMYGYTFKLNGPPVAVEDPSLFAGNSHFTEK